MEERRILMEKEAERLREKEMKKIRYHNRK